MRLHTGVIVLDTIDIICISFSAGSGIAWLVRIYKKRKQKKGKDPIIAELKRKSPIVLFSKAGNPLKLPLVRGGSKLRGFSLVLKNKRVARIIMAIIAARKKQRQLRLLSDFFFLLNNLLTVSAGLRIAVGCSLDYTQIILFGLPSSVGGFLIAHLIAHPLFVVLLPLAILSGRGIKDIPDPYERCRLLCQVAAEYHNKQLKLEMKNMNSLLEDTAAALGLPIDQVPFVCEEQPLSLLQRYKLRSLLDRAEARKRVQYFDEFIERFPECDVDTEDVFNEALKLAKQIKVRN